MNIRLIYEEKSAFTFEKYLVPSYIVLQDNIIFYLVELIHKSLN